jgi:phosphate transport system protein
VNVRKSFEKEIEGLKNSLLNMVELAEKAIASSLEALKTQDIKLAEEVIKNDQEINQIDEYINNKVIFMIAQQQPVATDLRKIIVALKISTDVERIGDLAVNIAKSTQHIGKEKLIKPIIDIPKMAEIAQLMLHQAFEAYNKEDVELALKLAEVDDQIDEMYGKLIKELLALMARNPENIAQITQLAFICRYIERVGDHATNMAENIIYMVKGKQSNLNT